MQIEDWRREIDSIDDALIRLLNRRAKIAVEVGVLKRTVGLPLCDPERERAVLTKVCAANTGPLDDEAITKLFRHIIRESLRVEARLSDEARV
jgi:chorismate mutase